MYYAGGAKSFPINTYLINDIPTIIDGMSWHICSLDTKGFSDSTVVTRSEERNFGWGLNHTAIVIFDEGMGNLAYILIA